jgi:hypothetical protein
MRLGEVALALVLGVVAGAGSVSIHPELPVALLAITFATAGAYIYIGKIPEGGNDLNLLRQIFLISVICRAGLAIVIHYVVRDASALAGDESTYQFLGQVISLYWKGELREPPEVLERFGIQRGYLYWNAAWLYLFGDVQLAPKLLNTVFGALVPVYLYRIAYRLFNAQAARLTLIVTAVIPSMILWSTLNLRDAAATLGITAAIYYTVRLREELRPRHVVAFVLAMSAIAVLRSYMFVIVGGALAFSFIRLRPGHKFRDLAVGLMFLFLLLYLFRGLGVSDKSEIKGASLETIGAMRRGLATGGSAFATEADISSPGKALLFLPVGIAYILFAPFPWQLVSFRQILTFPEVLLFYYLVPAMVGGVRRMLRENIGASLPVLLPALLVTIAYALVEGNVGTAYRHKGQILGLFLMTAMYYLSEKKSPAEARAGAS